MVRTPDPFGRIQVWIENVWWNVRVGIVKKPSLIPSKLKPRFLAG
jgi:hypothetical protein